MISATLKELNVQAGDVVELVSYEDGSPAVVYKGIAWTVYNKHPNIDARGPVACYDHNGHTGYTFVDTCAWKYRVIANAYKPKTWYYMTPEEKGAILLAQYEGKEIEFYNPTGLRTWMKLTTRTFKDSVAYRVSQTKHVTLYGPSADGSFVPTLVEGMTHSLTYAVVNDCIDSESIGIAEI